MTETTTHLVPESFKQMVENNWDSIVFANLEGWVLYANPAAHALYGYGPGELAGQHVDIFNSQKTLGTDKIVTDIIEKGGWSGELTQRRKDNTDFHALLTVWLIYNEEGVPIGYASNSKNISDRINARNILVQKQSELEESLAEREALLSEIHHRLKNNLAIISSLLHVQEITSGSEEVKEILSQCQSRIKSTALVHELLYQNKSLTKIPFAHYTQQLVSMLSDTFGAKEDEVKIDIKSPDVKLNINQAVPCGLLLNEIITNSYKHVFESQRFLQMKILVTVSSDNMELVITDNGQGLPDEVDFSNSISTGLTLIKAFVNQLDGSITYDGTEGTCYHINFTMN